MRVVFLTHNYPRHAGDVAGAFLHPIAVELRRSGVDVRVIAPSDTGRGGADALDGVPIRRMRYGAPEEETLAYRGTMASGPLGPSRIRLLLSLGRALRDGARQELSGASQGVLHAHWWIPAGMAAPPEWPMVATCHGTDVRLAARNAIARYLARRTLRRARVVTTVSHSLARVLGEQVGVPVLEDDIVPMSVATVERPWSEGGGGILIVGRLSPQKRLSLALEAYAVARGRGLTLPLTIVGDGPAATEVAQQVQGMACRDSIQLVGEVPPADVPRWYARADLAVMTAEGEGFGLAAAEALMQGVPVVACSDGGGVLDIVPTEGAGRIAPPTPEGVASAMLDCLADPDARPAARGQGAALRTRLAPASIAASCRAWYRRALER